ncbi:Rrf2 family transcriptional regulator [Pseudoduganella dura]|nr:Rrf2 family transcriptional regulator [Pseudoduganella dura]
MDSLDAPATSETIAGMLNTNPVVVRRTMAGLREHGYVQSGKGHGGGWALARPLAEVTLLDIHHALGDPPVFALGTTGEHADCLVERAVNAELGDAMREAERLLLERFGRVTLADLAKTVKLQAAKGRAAGG